MIKCDVCNKEYQKKWYKNNAAAHKQKISINRKKSKQENRDYIYNFLSNSCCNTCGEKDILVLEFDHKNPQQKSFDLGRAHMKKNLTIKELVKEIAKCVVRCGNCHKITTQQEQNTWRWQKVNATKAKESTNLL